MRRTLLASLGAALALCVWAGNAAADDGSAAGLRPAGPTAPSDPTLDAFSLVSQQVPEFGAAAQPVATPDAAPAAAPAAAPEAAPEAAPAAAPEAAPAETNGASQANGTAAGSLGANGNETSQTVDQEQGGDDAYPSAPAPATVAPEPAKAVPASGSTQVAGQSAENEQTADATATATQIHPTNESASIRVLSPGDDGPVTQSNDSLALAGALNGNETTQDLGQSQGGSGSGGKQIAGQSAKNDQSASADASSEQIKPTNSNISVRILSPGDDGDVSQSNTNVAGALAVNGNDTGQSIDQSQGGSYGGTQVAGQKADSKQTADATADAKQVHPENSNISVRILSPGSNGSVSQSNTNVAGSLAANVNTTCQCITQNQAGGPGGGATQIAGQSASSWQHADADATAKQIEPKNQNIAVRVLSPGADGPVSQSNTNIALSGALNLNKTGQGIDQEQGGGTGGVTQVAGQKAVNGQDATSSAYADQVEPSNLNVPVRVLSHGGDGSVEQSNTTVAGSLAANGNHTDQWIGQDPHGYGGTSLQAAGQLAGNHQSADSVADAAQCCASNVNAPVDVLSHGGGGSVRQSNDVVALAAALNLNATGQSIWQSSGGGGGTSIQAAGQKADSSQDATADADALQVHPSNVNAPTGVLDDGGHCTSKCDGPKRDCSSKCDEPKRDCTSKCDEPKRDCSSKCDDPKRDGSPWDGPKDGGSSWDGPKRDCSSKCDEPKRGDDSWDGPKRDACGRYDGCTPRQPCASDHRCTPRKPERRVDRCKHPEHRKPDPCAKRPRCERKDPCSDRSGPEPRKGPMPMN
jgi:hypothetical protein